MYGPQSWVKVEMQMKSTWFLQVEIDMTRSLQVGELACCVAACSMPVPPVFGKCKSSSRGEHFDCNPSIEGNRERRLKVSLGVDWSDLSALARRVSVGVL